MEFKVRDNARIYYETYGDKKNKALIFLHGNMEDSSLFQKQTEYFSDRFYIVVVDTRGHGKSDWGSGSNYNLKVMAEDLNELTTGLNLNDYIVVGFSDGANIAMEFAGLGIKGLSGLVLIGGNLRPWGLKFGIILDIIKDYIKSYWRKDSLLIRKKLGLMLFEPKISPSSLGGIDVPTLVLAGEYDLIRKSETLRISRLIRGSEVAFVKNADHFFVYNNGDIFNKMLELWINSV